MMENGLGLLDRLKGEGARRPRRTEASRVPPIGNTLLSVTSSDDPGRQPEASDKSPPELAPPLQHGAPSCDIPERNESRYDLCLSPVAPGAADRNAGDVLEEGGHPVCWGSVSGGAPQTGPTPGLGSQPGSETTQGHAPSESESLGANTGRHFEVPGPPTQRSPFFNDLLDHLAPWTPGTRVVYRKPRGGQSRSAEVGFPIWAVAGQPPLEAMFQAADQICGNAFYVAADQWNGARLVKEFGAFTSAEEFLHTLRRSPVQLRSNQSGFAVQSVSGCGS